MNPAACEALEARPDSDPCARDCSASQLALQMLRPHVGTLEDTRASGSQLIPSGLVAAHRRHGTHVIWLSTLRVKTKTYAVDTAFIPIVASTDTGA
jgi:hypothetical protein